MGVASPAWGESGANWNQNPQFSSNALPMPSANQTWNPHTSQPGQTSQPLPWSQQSVSQFSPSAWPQPRTGDLQQQEFQNPQRALVPAQPQVGTGLIPTNTSLTGSLQEEYILQQMVPAISEEQGPTVYVPPMYTSPRPIIPKYRIISGLLSFLIVMLLLCTGASYYAKASGQLDAFQHFYGGGHLQNIQPTAPPNLPDPPQDIVKGPAYNIIPSATTARRIDPKSLVAIQPEKNFRVGETIYVTYSVKTPDKPGAVNIKWYMNNLYFGPAKSDIIDPKKTPNGNGKTQIIYIQPAEGYVELYWNDQMAQRLYFVVRP